MFDRVLSIHCVKSVQIQSFFWSVISCIKTEYGDLLRKSVFNPNTGKYGQGKKSVFRHPFL